jgi:hypothetical protein
VLDAFLDALHCCCTLLIVAKLGDMARPSLWGTATGGLVGPEMESSTISAAVPRQLVDRMACSLGPGYTRLREWFILTVPRPWHNSKTARIPQSLKNNDH